MPLEALPPEYLAAVAVFGASSPVDVEAEGAALTAFKKLASDKGLAASMGQACEELILTRQSPKLLMALSIGLHLCAGVRLPQKSLSAMYIAEALYQSRSLMRRQKLKPIDYGDIDRRLDGAQGYAELGLANSSDSESIACFQALIARCRTRRHQLAVESGLELAEVL